MNNLKKKCIAKTKLSNNVADGTPASQTLCEVEELRKQVDTICQLFHLNVSDDAEQELVTEQIKSIVSELQQSELDTDTPLDCKKCG